MKKNILKLILVAAIAVAAGWKISQGEREVKLPHWLMGNGEMDIVHFVDLTTMSYAGLMGWTDV